MSINLILKACQKTAKQKTIVIWFPDYFCDQTIASLKEDWITVEYYPITETLDPDWAAIHKMLGITIPDVFVFTHYFGKYHSQISRAKEICSLNHIILIEDCAHVLYEAGKIGDFAVFSPHKQLPVQDAAILACNVSEKNRKIWDELCKFYQELPQKTDPTIWYIKKALQKILPIHRKLLYYPGVHWGNGGEGYHTPQKISRESYHTLCDYDYDTLKKIAYIRRDNLCIMNYILKQRYPDIIPLLDETVPSPYLAVYSLEKMSEKEKAAAELLKAGFTLLHWPDLPSDLPKKGHEKAIQLSENIITFPIHQGVTPQKIIKKLNNITAKVNKINITVKWDNVTESEWQELQKKYHVTNIPQDYLYGNAKQKTEGWKVKRAVIETEDKRIGTIQILEKKTAGITVAVRVNRGPLLIPEYNREEIHFMVMEQIRKKYLHPIPIIYAPMIEMSAENLSYINAYGWKGINMFGYSSSLVDLLLTSDELEKNLKPNWRKNLKKAKREVHIKYNEYDANEIMDLYDGFLKRKSIPGIPRHILEYLFALEAPPFEVLTAHNRLGEKIAYKVLYKHGSTATSFIAWNTEEGLEKNARTLLIYSSMLHLKNLGFRYFDLGGVDDINTEAVAKYKRGMGGKDYRLLGEFIKF